MVELLRGEHQITVLAPGDAFEFLAPLYQSSDVRVREIPGLRFRYRDTGRLDSLRTAGGAARYLRGLPRLIGEIEELLTTEAFDLAITDFEPGLPRAARRCRVPLLSVSHQHFLLTYDLRCLPRSLRLHAAYMRWIVRAYYSGQTHTVVSSFYFPPLRPGCQNVTQVGVLLRPELREAAPVPGDYLVATAGNQLVGETLFLGKPCFGMPEAGNFEQYINAHFLGQTGAGRWMGLEQVVPKALQEFE